MARSNRVIAFFASLTGRMLLGMLVIHALLVPLLYYGVISLTKEGYQTQFIQQVRSNSQLFAVLFAQEIAQKSPEEMVSGALQSGQVIFAQIMTPDGQTVNPKNVANADLGEFKEDFFFGQHGDTVYYISVSLRDEDGNISGVLRLGYDEEPTQEQIKTAYQRGLFLVLAYGLLSLALVIFSGWQITRSLRRLGNAAHQVAMGEITKQLDVPTNISEVTSLGQDLERMRWKLVHQGELLEHQALHDSLTGLPNRTLLHDRMQHAFVTAQRLGKTVALLMMDLDRFKEVNDTLGHHVGDLLLQQIALRMRGALRESDTIARLGGDEFAVVLPSVENPEQAVHTAQKILTTLEQPLNLDGHSFTIGASIGIAFFPEHGEDNDTLMRHADLSMYYAKRTQSGYSIYNPTLNQQGLNEITLIGELRHAIQHNELILHYQPKVDLKTGRVTGVEALVRWQHPRQGLLLPEHFLHLAERTGLIHPLTSWVLNEALRTCQSWHQADIKLPVAVNLSPASLQHDQLFEQINHALQSLNTPPFWLELEITEAAILADPQLTQAVLGRLSDLGVQISIDDYGTASFASLAYFNKLPIQRINIDKSFVIEMSDETNAVIVRSAINLAHNMKRTVSAEGVEHPDTLKKLKELGCDIAQGNYLCEPLAANELIGWLQQPYRDLTDKSSPLAQN
ncbi:MAG: EAL domain-containing protein [Gammaproteobacteria bacterium]|nr:EAL domain-containing protein [Gammaproteobacteria bacterium]